MEQPSLFGSATTGGDQVAVYFKPDFAGWQAAARTQWRAGVPPERVWWQPDSEAARPPNDNGDRPRVSKAFIQLARAAACYRSADRWALLYRLLWRITHGERHLLQLAGDPDVARVTRYAKAVRRDVHKMKAFVRFRAVVDADSSDGEPRYVAWFEPEHLIVEYAAGFFQRRFANMRWSILTPDRCVHWEGPIHNQGKPWFSPGADKSAAPNGDVLEDAWRIYYQSIFNPARVKIGAMQSEMPVKYWKNMPEAHLIPGLIRDADRRVAEMEARRREDDVLRCGPRPATPDAVQSQRSVEFVAGSLEQLALKASMCRHCPLYSPATQTVFGEGPADAAIMLVGEQPGDAEDLAGRPFVGPAGQLLDRALAEAGLDRSRLYLTNTVKHFKFTPRGKQRLHAKPDYHEVRACRPWLEAELNSVAPSVVIALGATAAGALLQRPVQITRERGRLLAWRQRRLMVTVHPAYLLRRNAQKGAHYARFVADLSAAATA